jgi:peptidoglycan hydrolase-like protein with peptidoglycan-binding domain
MGRPSTRWVTCSRLGMSAIIDLSERPLRDLATAELWSRSLARSLARRATAASGEVARRSLVSAAFADLDGPRAARQESGGPGRDLADGEIWDFSLACAHAKRRAAERGFLPQARVAGASLVVAAVAAALPVQGGAHSRARGTGVTQVDERLLRLGSRGPAVARLQRALGIRADGVFGPQTRAAVRTYQARHGLAADGIVGPKTRSALFGRPAGGRLIRAWWVAPLQRALDVPVDGVYGPISRAAVRAYQARHGLIVDGIVGPKTLGHLGIRRGGGHSHGSGNGASAPAPSSRGERVVAIAKRYLGIPYRWGGASPGTGFDCSGFVMYVYAKVGVSLPHNAAAQYRYGRSVSRANLAPGDLVFFNGLGHNGIYVGSGRFIHSPHTGDVVKISSIHDSWYASTWVGARRV